MLLLWFVGDYFIPVSVSFAMVLHFGLRERAHPRTTDGLTDLKFVGALLEKWGARAPAAHLALRWVPGRCVFERQGLSGNVFDLLLTDKPHLRTELGARQRC